MRFPDRRDPFAIAALSGAALAVFPQPILSFGDASTLYELDGDRE
jgi:hypothetical protein